MTDQPMSDAELVSESMAEYLARSEVSGGDLGLFITDPKLYQRHVVRGEPRPSTDALDFGRLIHAHVLEPDTVATDFAVIPRRHDLDPDLFGTAEGAKKVDMRTKAGKEAMEAFERDSQGRTVIPPALWDRAPRMLRALKEHETAASLLWGGEAINEATCIFTEPETSTRMRARFDRFNMLRPAIVELKTARSLIPDIVRTEWYRLGYHRKAAIHIDAARALIKQNVPFFYVFVESSDDPEPDVAVYRLDTDSPAVAIGRDEYTQALYALETATIASDFRSSWVRGDEDYPLPGYVLARAEFVIGGREDAPAAAMDGAEL